jgi:uncharacterized protein
MQTLSDIKERAVPILRGSRAVEAYLFGSVARNEAGPESDVDILVRFSEPRGGLMEFIHTKHELEDAIGRKVDLIEMGALRKEFRSYVDKDKVRIL